MLCRCFDFLYTPLITDEIRLWYADREYSSYLGQLVTVWTTHVSSAKMETLSVLPASLVTSIFPERDSNCFLLLHTQSEGGVGRLPLGYRYGQPLHGAVTLKNFVEGGADLPDAKVLVCVKAIGTAENRKAHTSSHALPNFSSFVVPLNDSNQARLRPNRRVPRSAPSTLASPTKPRKASSLFILL